MNKILLPILLLAVSSTLKAGYNSISGNQLEDRTEAKQLLASQPVAFMENKGQFFDEDARPVPFVLFKAELPGLDMYLTEKGFTYVFLKYSEDKMGRDNGRTASSEAPFEKDEVKIEWERIDMNLKGASIKRENIIKEGPSMTDFNFFYSHCPEGIYGVKEFNRITVKDVYPGIDLVLYNSSQQGFKYDFIVSPGANPELIELVYSSLQPLSLNKDGSIEVQTSKLGKLLEKAPESYQGNQNVLTHFIKTLNQKNDKGGYDSHVKFELGDYDKSLPLTIDPIVVPNLMWGTYYGGSEIGGPSSMEVDSKGDIYITTYVYKATFPLQNMPGAYYQSNMSGSGGCTGGILKFNAARQRVWSTLYGGTTGQGLYQNKPTCVTVDNADNIFITGMTECNNFPVQNPGGGAYFQGTTGGGYSDIFILKFNSAGVRQWATYYGGGGSGSEVGTSIVTDAAGNVFVTGSTESTTFPLQNLAGAYNQATIGGSIDAFILKFDNSGVRLWATYYGGTGKDKGNAIAVDNTGNVLITGYTLSANLPMQNLAGAYNQPTYGGGTASWPSPGGDAFIAKCTGAGSMQWATYYGSTTGEEGMAITSDNTGNIFVAGITYGTSAFPTQDPGGGAYFQGTYLGGATDLFILKFSPAGVRQWATFCGGSGDDSFVRGDLERGSEITTDPANGDFFLTATTKSANFPTLNAGGYFNATMQGNQDAVIMQFSNAGVIKWSTYQGGTSRDWGNAVDMAPDGCLIVVGEWQGGGSNGLVNPGAPAYYDGSYGALGDDLAIMQFCSSCTTPSGTITATQASCTANDGSATVNVSGGQTPYTYQWTPGGQTTATATGLAAGTYSVIVSETGGCTKTFTVTVAQQSSLTSTVTSSPASCGNNNGSATVSASGGTGPLSYQWSPSGGSLPNATGLSPGNYTATVTDANGCTSVQTASITSTAALNTTITPTSPPCGAGTGSATVSVNGGTGPFTYVWSPSGGNGSSASNLAAGNYTVTISDASGCTDTQTITITSGIPITSSITEAPTTCGNAQGSATVTITSGGAGPFTYSWSPSGGNGAVATGLAAGTYFVLITDASGCTQTDTAIINNSNGPSLTLAGQNNILCNGAGNGSAVVTVNGGVAPYNYTWSPAGGNAPSASGLSAGSYTVVVSDANGCTHNIVVAITEPGPLTVVATSTPVCVSNGGFALATASGGTAPFTYAWSPSGGNTAAASGLTSGNYSVNVTDANGCVTSSSVNVLASNPPVVSVSPDVTITQGQTTTLTATGGGSYSWSNGSGVPEITVGPPYSTSFCVVVSNSAGCTDTACVLVTVEPIDCSEAGDVFLPTAFSPDGDGENDEWGIYYGNYLCIKDFELVVYNRWGEKVFESTDPMALWNGEYKSRSEATAVFVYFLKVNLITGQEIEKKGNVSLLR